MHDFSFQVVQQGPSAGKNAADFADWEIMQYTLEMFPLQTP